VLFSLYSELVGIVDISSGVCCGSSISPQARMRNKLGKKNCHGAMLVGSVDGWQYKGRVHSETDRHTSSNMHRSSITNVRLDPSP
jgi:hypothetical protein